MELIKSVQFTKGQLIEAAQEDIAAISDALQCYMPCAANKSLQKSLILKKIALASLNAKLRAGQDCIITSECGCIIYEVDQSNLTQKITDRNVFTHSVTCNYPVNVPSVINRHGIAHHSVIIIKRVQPVSNLIVINRAGTVTGISVFHVFFHMVWRVYA